LDRKKTLKHYLPYHIGEYEKAQKAGIPMDNHYSDLYLLVCPKSKELIAEYPYKQSVSTFLNQIDNNLWFEIPFEFYPYWANLPESSHKK
jgi:hypothetical protein